MIIEATFTGKNSLGYENGKKYILKVADSGGMTIRRLEDASVMPVYQHIRYQSVLTFLRNWSNIKVVS